MKRSLLVACVCGLSLCISELSSAGTLSVTLGGRKPTPLQVANGVPESSFIHEFYVTTDSDILSISNVFIELTAPLYQVGVANGGSDVAPPNPVFEAIFPQLGADTWITTPGGTSTALAGGFDSPDNSWFDTSDDGAQQNFLFARLTTSGKGTFTFRVNTRGDDGPVASEFSFFIPEPGTVSLAGLALAGGLIRRRRAA